MGSVNGEAEALASTLVHLSPCFPVGEKGQQPFPKMGLLRSGASSRDEEAVGATGS